MAPQKGSDLYLSPNEQDLLVAALNSNQPKSMSSGANLNNSSSSNLDQTPQTTNPGSGQLDFSDDSPYLDFDPDGDFDDSFGYGNSRMIGDLPPDLDGTGGLHEKRKSIDGEDDDDEGGGKRREGEDKVSKKPGRKPLTSEPTSKRKAQNRAAQRAFRERKERHLKDLETKVEDLEKASEATNHENGLLKAQVERLQVELKEYRKRLSWISSNGIGRSNSQNQTSKSKSSAVSAGNDFQFEFPKFGDLPAMSSTNIFGAASTNGNRSGSLPGRTNGVAKDSPASRSNSQGQSQRQSSMSQSPMGSGYTTSPPPMNNQQGQQQSAKGSVDTLSGLFSPSILEATRHASLGGYFPQSNGNNANRNVSMPNGNGMYSHSSTSNSDSPGSSSESHNAVSSIGTSPEPSLNSPGNKLQEFNLNTINEENSMPGNFGKDQLCKEISRTCGCTEDPIPPILQESSSNDVALGFDNSISNTTFDATNLSWLPSGNTAFDPVLFGDYRETQDNILSQDFGSFFNDAYPLPDLGSPLHNYNDVTSDQMQVPMAPRTDLLSKVDAAMDREEVVPDNDKPMTCNKIWDRLQSMEKFRNGEIDIDNLCSELRAKAKCSEGGAVVDKKDVDKILGK